MKFDNIKDKAKELAKKTITNPFETLLNVAMYIVAWAAGLWCVGAAIDFAGKLLYPLLPG